MADALTRQQHPRYPAEVKGRTSKAFTPSSKLKTQARPRKTNSMHLFVAGIPDDLPAYDRCPDFDIANFCGINREDVVSEKNHVCQLARRDRAFLVLLEFGVGGTQSVGLDGFRQGKFLLGKPAIGIFAIQSRARNRGVDRQHGVERSNVPIRTQCKPDAMIQEGAKAYVRLERS